MAAAAILPDRMTTIKRRGNALCVSERQPVRRGLVRVKHYLLAFRSVTLARRISYMLPEGDPEIYIVRVGTRVDLTERVRDLRSSFTSREEEEDQSEESRVLIGIDDELHITKRQMIMNRPATPPEAYYLDDMSTREVFSLPMQNLGLVLPSDVRAESESGLVLTCAVIEPYESTNSLRKLFQPT